MRLAVRRPDLQVRHYDSLTVMSRPPRLKGFEYTGFWRYFATSCTHQRKPAFLDASVVQGVVSQFLQAADEERCELLAYCLMPDHVHLLIGGTTDNAQFKRFMK